MPVSKKRLTASMLLFLLLGGGAWKSAGAQDCDTSQTEEPKTAESWTVRRRVDEVQVLFTATRHGKFIGGLTQNDVKVWDNNAPAAVVAFRGQENLPLRIALLIDTSNSIHKRFLFEKKAAILFLQQTLRSKDDEAVVAGFNDRLQLAQGFTHDVRLLSSGIAGLQSNGATAMFDAVSQACGLLAQSGQGMVARVLVVVSDGDDNMSKSSLRSAVERADETQVTIYAIGTNYQTDDIASWENLKHLSRATGGRALFPATARQVRRDFARIREDLRHRYEVAYRPPEFARDGRFHRIHVEARWSGKNLKVQARRGYYAR